MRPLIDRTSGISLIELILGATIGAVLVLTIGTAVRNFNHRSVDIEKMQNAQRELELIELQLKKDFSRHVPSNGVSGATSANFNIPISGQPCRDISIRQRNTTNSGKIRKLEYKTVCPSANSSLPPGFAITEIHPELNCNRAPSLSVTTYEDESTMTHTTHHYPSANSVAVAVCFRPDSASGFETLYTAELSAAYETSTTGWKITRKRFTLPISQYGAGVEIVPPK